MKATVRNKYSRFSHRFLLDYFCSLVVVAAVVVAVVVDAVVIAAVVRTMINANRSQKAKSNILFLKRTVVTINNGNGDRQQLQQKLISANNG